MQAFKTESGQTLHKFLACYQRDQHFHNVEIIKKDGDEEQFQSKRSQFFQALHDNIKQRFPSTDLLQAASCLNQSFWPSEPIKKALFGEAQIATLCRSLNFSPSTTADVVLEYSVLKRTDGNIVGDNLKSLTSLLEILPISSAECERGFSQMNLQHSAVRNRLLVTSVSDLLMIGINGPPLCHWSAEKYVVSWFKASRHGALDKATGLPRKERELTHSSKLFLK